MLEYARWKYVVAVLVLIVATIYSLPNLYPQDTAVQIAATRGGTVDEALKERVQGVLERSQIGFKSIAIEDNNLLVRLADPNLQIRAADTVRGEVGQGYVVALNLASTVPDWLTSIGANPMKLGLDLQGGVHFLMEVDQKAALEKRETGFVDDIRGLLRESKIPYSGVDRGANGILIRLRDAADRNAAASLVGREVPQLLVEDGSEPNLLLAHLQETELKTIIDNAVEQNIGTLRNRINELGVADPVVQRQGANRIVVQLPGVQDTAQASAPPPRWNTAPRWTATRSTRRSPAACRPMRGSTTSAARIARSCSHAGSSPRATSSWMRVRVSIRSPVRRWCR